MHEEGRLINQSTDQPQEGVLSEEDEPFEKIEKPEGTVFTIGSCALELVGMVGFTAARKAFSRRTLIRQLWHTLYKNNIDHTLEYLAQRKQFNPNYYLDTAISEARINNDMEFIEEIEPLIDGVLRRKLEFSKENTRWLLFVKEAFKEKKLDHHKQLLKKFSAERIEENKVILQLQQLLPQEERDKQQSLSEDESNSPEKLTIKILSKSFNG